MRCKVLENILQNALGEAKQVWVIGDVHGCAIELENLLTKLDLKSGDHALLVGDLIDRGPDSARVVDLVRSSDNLHTIKGNHEQMMISGFVEKFGRGGPSMETMLWLSNGGLDTIKSFDRMYDDGNSRLEETSTWFRSLPSQVILDGFRIVHAGFTPDVSMREQTDDSMLWIRNIFFDHPKPLDEQRQIIFGHTPTQYIEVAGRLIGIEGRPTLSPVLLGDGRPSWIGIDTGVCGDQTPTLTAYNLATHEFRGVTADV